MPVAAATEVSGLVADLAIVLLAAKIGDELFKRIGQPTLIGEILGGLLVGPSVLGLVELSEALKVFAELGVVFLLFWVGLEVKVSDMRDLGPSVAGIGVGGVILPFGAGALAGLAFDESTETSLFIGAALAATSVGITSAVFAELGQLSSRAARMVLGAAIVDDVLALLLVGVASAIAVEGSFDVAQVVVSLGLATGFVAVFALGGTAAMRRFPKLLHMPRFSESPLLPAVILCLAIAALAAEIGLATVIGAFLAGMIVAETHDQEAIEAEIAPLYAFFPPFFFASIGLMIDLDALADGQTLLVLAGLTVLAAVTKLAAAWPFTRSMRREGWVVGVGMVPRGEVGIVVAGIGGTLGVIDQSLFAAIVGMSIATTLIAPPALRSLFRAAGSSPQAE